MSRTAAAPFAQDFVPFATAALDFHRALNIPAGPLVTSRAELDSLHEHLVAVYELLDAHALRTGSLVPAEADHLGAARTRIWQAATDIHAAYHSAPALVLAKSPTVRRATPDCPKVHPS
ncbi:DUF6238 family protein [Streptomyces sp. NBC_00138]